MPESKDPAGQPSPSTDEKRRKEPREEKKRDRARWGDDQPSGTFRIPRV